MRKLHCFTIETSSFSYNGPNGMQSASGIIEKAIQKGIQKPSNVKITKINCLCPKQQVQQIIQIDLIHTTLPWRNKRN